MTEKEFMLLVDEACGVKPGTVTRDDSLSNSILFDSLSMLMLIAMLDEKFEVDFNMEELSTINTIGNLFDKVAAELQI